MSGRDARPARPLTGRAVLAIALGAFGVVIAANLVLVFSATGTFPGLVVPNSYVASQDFDRDRAAQEALGWTVALTAEGAELVLAVTDRDGRPVPGLAVTARLARPATDAAASDLAFAGSDGTYRAPNRLAPGLWRAALALRAPDGRHWSGEARLSLPVRP